MQAQIDQFLHELQAWETLPEDAITFWSRWQAAYPLLVPLAPRPGSCASIPSLRGTRVLRMRMASAGHRNKLSKNLEMHVSKTEQGLGVTVVCMTDQVKTKSNCKGAC